MRHASAPWAGYRLAWPLALVVLAGVLWLALLWVALRPTPPAWDQSLYASFRSWDVPALGGLLRVVAWAGNTPVAAVYILAVVVVLLILRRRRLSAVFALGGVLDLANSTALQALIGRSRPDQLVHPGTDSFPSGHAFNSVIFLGLVVAVVLPQVEDSRLRVGIMALWTAFVIATGLSRVHLGHHWPTDVLGGYLLGALALALIVWLRSRIGWR